MKTVREWTPFTILLICIILIRLFVVTLVRVDGPSMNMTLLDGEILLLEKYNQNYERFDIVVFEYNGEKLIKRIIGLPEETIMYKNNVLYIDGKKTEENYGYGISRDFDLSEINLTKIPKNEYFVVGDNRNNSLDSRNIGTIKKENIIGKTRLALYPFKKFGKIEK